MKIKSISKRHDGIVETYKLKIAKDCVYIVEGGDYAMANDRTFIPLDVWEEFVKFYNLNKRKGNGK